MSNEKKKIVFLANIDSFFISHRLEIGKQMLSNGYDVHIAAEFTKYKKRLTKMGFKTHNIQFSRNSLNLFKLIKPLIQIFYLFISQKPNILHLISLKPIVFGGIVSILTPVKSIVISITGFGSIYIGKSIGFRLKQILINLILLIIFLRKNIKVIVQNKSDLKFLIKNTKINKSKTVLIKGSGVNLNKFKYSKILIRKKPIILMASRLIADKGVYEYIKSIRYLNNFGFKSTNLLIGNVDLENPSAIKLSEIKEWEKEGIIKYHKHTNNIKNFIRKSTIVVLPSYREGFPKILIEAAACGRPAVTTNVPGCRDAVVNNKTGVLVPPKNFIKLAQSIQRILNNKRLLNFMNISSRKHAEKNFNVSNVVSKHINIYNSLNSNN